MVSLLYNVLKVDPFTFKEIKVIKHNILSSDKRNPVHLDIMSIESLSLKDLTKQAI